jgi:hypothetical protein
MHYHGLKNPLFMRVTDGTGMWTQFSDQVRSYGYPTVVYPSQWMYQQPVCFMPQSVIGFVKLGGAAGLHTNNHFPTVSFFLL